MYGTYTPAVVHSSFFFFPPEPGRIHTTYRLMVGTEEVLNLIQLESKSIELSI